MSASKVGGAAAQSEIVIECERVSKTYETGKISVEALRGIDLRVGRGEVVAVMGPSGCGKTTLLNCLSGLDDVSAGSVRIEGKEIVELPLLLTGASRGEARKRAHESLKVMGLEGREAHLPAELSGGEQQRVAIARSIVNSPAILWADEPTGNLDTQTALKVIELLLQVNARTGQTVVMVTHDPNVGKRSHRILHMDSGVMVSEDTGELATAGRAA